MNPLPLVFDDGGRKAAGFPKRRDCVTRSLAIAGGMPYLVAAGLVNFFAAEERITKARKKRGRSSAGSGVYRPTIRKVFDFLGWEWVPLMGIGTGCKVHLRQGELPPDGPLVASVSGHLVAVVDGVVRDTHDCTRRGMRCVYGFWKPRLDWPARLSKLMECRQHWECQAS